MGAWTAFQIASLGTPAMGSPNKGSRAATPSARTKTPYSETASVLTGSWAGGVWPRPPGFHRRLQVQGFCGSKSDKREKAKDQYRRYSLGQKECGERRWNLYERLRLKHHQLGKYGYGGERSGCS
jgi:hypothetical protein